MRKNLLLALCLFIFIPAISFSASSSKNFTDAASNVSAEPAIGSIQEAIKEFESLSKHERKEKIKEVKKAIKQFKADKRAESATSTNTLLLVILAIILPPLAVYLHEGAINTRFWLDLILTLLFFIPGVIYALIVVLGNT